MKIGILGCGGRMGQMLVREVLKNDNCEISGGAEKAKNEAVGLDIGVYAGLVECGIKITADSKKVFKASDVVIDFTLPMATGEHLKLAHKEKTSLVIGTTGHNTAEMRQIKTASKKIAIVKAMNFSIGVNVLLSAAERLSTVLDDSYDVEILEMHHKYKLDSPSGTALALGGAVAKGRSVELEKVSVRARDGILGVRNKGEIGFSSLRGGEVIGDHSVIFAGANERIEITHKAASREIFCEGAVKAARWVEGKKPGLFDMQDVLGLDRR